MSLRLNYRGAFDWESMLGFLSARAIAGVEAVGRARATCAALTTVGAEAPELSTIASTAAAHAVANVSANAGTRRILRARPT